MMARLRTLWFTLVFCGLSVTAEAGGQPYDVFYLSIGVTSHRDASLDIPGANLSARQIGHYFDSSGARQGTVLESKEGDLLQKSEVLGALRSTIQSVRSASNPLVIFYFTGHGAFSRQGFTHISILGEYDGAGTVREAPQPKPQGGGLLGGLAGGLVPDLGPAKPTLDTTSILETNEVIGILNQSGVPYLVILDNCYFRTEVAGLAQLADAYGDSVDSIGNRLIDMVQGPEGGTVGRPTTVLFAASRGKTVKTQPHPLDDTAAVDEIGPLARRIILIMEAARKDGQGRSIGAFVSEMTNSDFDFSTVPGETRIAVANSDKGRWLIPVGKPKSAETRATK